MPASPGRPQSTRAAVRSNSVDGAAATTLSKSLSELVIYVVVCVAVLLAGQFIAGHILILAASGPFGLEAERKTAIADGFRELLSQREELHARYASDFAQRDRLANAFAQATPGPAVTEIFTAREPDLERFDLVLAVDDKNRLLYGAAELRDRRLEREFLEITALKVRDLKPEREPGDAPPLRAATGPLYWHYTVAHGEHIYLLTLAAVGDDRGYPIQEGFVLFAERLETLLAEARRQLNLKSASLSSMPIATAYASVPLEAYVGASGDESPQFYISLEPHDSLAALARRLLHALLVLEALLAFALVHYGLPHIYREPGDIQPAPLPAKSETSKSASAKPSSKASTKAPAKKSEKTLEKTQQKTADKAAEKAPAKTAEKLKGKTPPASTKQPDSHTDHDSDAGTPPPAPATDAQVATRADETPPAPVDPMAPIAADPDDSPAKSGIAGESPLEQPPANESPAAGDSESKTDAAPDERPT